MSDDTPNLLNNVITIDDERIKSHLDRVVRSTVEETLNALLDAEADRLCNAQRYERSEARRDTRAGHYERGLQTKAGEVRLRVPKLRRQAFETAIIERYRRRESSVEEALIEMYLAGVSVRRVEDITEALWGTRVSPSTVSDLNKKIYGTIEAWRNRPIEGDHPYVYLDGIVLKRSWAGEVRNVSLLVAIGVNERGYREILGICEGAKEDKTGWSVPQASQGTRIEGCPADHLGCLHWACRKRREETAVHSFLACSHAWRLLPFQLLSVFRVGTWQRKKRSFGLAARARRNRRIRAAGRWRIANSSSIRCSVSRFDPLIGTFTKQSSGDQ